MSRLVLTKKYNDRAIGPFVIIMRRFLFLLLLVFSINSYADGTDIISEIFIPIQISKIYDSKNNIDIDNLPDLIDREIKVSACISEYIDRQSKTYAKIVQDNLYDLLHNLDKIQSKIYGKKYKDDDKVSRDEKLAALAQVQCDAYYEIGELK